MPTIRKTFWTSLCTLAICAPAAWAQQQGQQQPEDQAAKPIPAYRSPLAGAADNEDADGSNPNPNKLAPDDHSLAGAQVFSLGELAPGHSYWQPHMNVAFTADSNGLSSSGGWTSWSSFFGGVDVHRISGNSNLGLIYTGGVSVSNDGSSSTEIFQDLQFSEKLTFHRAKLSIIDDVSYLPESAFGYQPPGIGNVSVGGSIGLQPGLPPEQSILTAQGQRISNVLIPQVDVLLTPRSSLTFVGNYSILHYFDSNLLDFYGAGVQAGYNYQVTRKDTVAVLYHFTAYRYSNYNQSIDDHVAQLSYGRRVTGKLAFQIAAGPEYTTFETPISGTGIPVMGTPSGSTGNLYWSLNSSLMYQMRRTGFGLSYNHGVSGGSGVQAGSVADTVNGNVSHQFSRTWTGAWNVGYARNSGLTVFGPVSPVTTNQAFDYWTSNVVLNHSIGRTMNLSLTYLLQYQNSNSSFCLAGTCQTNFTRNQISVSFGWLDRPIAF